MRDESVLISELESEKKNVNDKYNRLDEFIDKHGDEIKKPQLEAMKLQRTAMLIYVYSLALRMELLKQS
ncbi:hypothetical protein ACFQ44_05900 [Levilactobacillus lanxiensis]|uniref:DUF2508 family protein n=1 Tax=Levilactobacillus lanxiensis TaxID=2799568 RepID=A0ABW4D5Q2_9LACO|nr:hypothetical protein [Levilactobacillus lanxiensis]